MIRVSRHVLCHSANQLDHLALPPVLDNSDNLALTDYNMSPIDETEDGEHILYARAVAKVLQINSTQRFVVQIQTRLDTSLMAG